MDLARGRACSRAATSPRCRLTPGPLGPPGPRGHHQPGGAPPPNARPRPAPALADDVSRRVGPPELPGRERRTPTYRTRRAVPALLGTAVSLRRCAAGDADSRP